MNVLMQVQLKGMTKEMYEANQEAGFLTKLESFDGFEGFHAGSPIEGGWQVVELWASEAAHKNWIETFVMPSMAAAGVKPGDIQMTTTYFPVHTAVVTKVAVAH